MELKILSLNCWLLPPPFSVNNKKRLSQIINLIKGNSPKIIALQEVWSSKNVEKIKYSLKEYFFIKSSSTLFNKSGLLTGYLKNISHFEINHFPITKKYNLLEKVVGKGYHVLGLSDNLFFVNTHLYNPINSSEKSINKLQFKTLQRLKPSKELIIVGDLNLNEGDLIKLNKRFNYDNSHGFTVSSSNKLTKTGFNKFGDSDLKIDYHLATKKISNSIVTKCVKKPIVSDHYMLISNIKIDKEGTINTK